jgi:hypothetical protein
LRHEIGKLAPTSDSYYGFQLDPAVLLNETMPKVADRMRQENVEAVLLTATLSVLENATEPRQIFHLPFTWPAEPKKTDWQPPDISPIVKLNLDEIKRVRAEARKKK